MSMLQRLANMGGKAKKTYIEDVFSTHLYTGNGSTQTINNGIDLAGKGGMVWIKQRNDARLNCVYDTARGSTNAIYTSSTTAQETQQGVTSFGSSGFSLGTHVHANASGGTYASWTFRKAPKFFDVVTYTGNGQPVDRAIPHNLGVTPGMYIVKRLGATSDWWVWHRSGTAYKNATLNSTSAYNLQGGLQWEGSVPINDTQFCVTGGGLNNTSNVSGATYVAYLFAHDTATDGLIQCGTYTTDASGNASVNLGWEPQYLTTKCTSAIGDWYTTDVMRGAGYNNYALLSPNTSTVETTGTGAVFKPTATGFEISGLGNSKTFIYMAIRRPMKVPTDGTKVFMPVTRTGTGVATTVNTTITPDTVITKNQAGAYGAVWLDRLRDNAYLGTTVTTAESAVTSIAPAQAWDSQTGIDFATNAFVNASSNTYINYALKRAPGFFDVVCYTGDGTTGRAVNHSLGVTPELVIVKIRDLAGLPWLVWGAPLGTVNALALNETTAPPSYGGFQSGSMTATTFNVAGINTNRSGSTFVSYLFASCPGVSKVGSYTGDGNSGRIIDCGFTNGARFVMIKRTDTAGDWYVWDSARGIVAAADPRLSLNTTYVEVTSEDSIDPVSTGFIINTGTVAINTFGGTFIYLAIA